uniref:Uncharacterized protein n=1 Tax=Anguilla anguilla TaxID=7936 RepID=A0A0E9RN25_ANGAN
MVYGVYALTRKLCSIMTCMF